MNSNLIANFGIKSVVVGALLAVTAVVLLGADKPDAPSEKTLPQRFLVLESTPTGEPANGYQGQLLTVSPHYGKIDRRNLKSRLESETQEIKMIVTVGEGHEFRRGDIIGFTLSQHIRLEPGSKVVRHLPSGDQELVGVMAVPLALVQLAVPSGVAKAETIRPRQPGGLLRDQLGAYLTIEGVKAEDGKIETGTLLVDTVDGKKLDKPISLVIRGAYVVNDNLQPARLDLPAKHRCVFKGFESGEMIGVPPAVQAAAAEQGWKGVPISPAQWQWRPYFVALIVVEPEGLELRKQ